MLIGGSDPVEVERQLVSGELSCPSCRGVLVPWGSARWRSCRGPVGMVRHRPRRSRCASCGGTHVLLAQEWLVRRADAVSVIGLAAAAGVCPSLLVIMVMVLVIGILSSRPRPS